MEIDSVSYVLGGKRGPGSVYDENSGRTISFWVGTIDEYNALIEKNADTMYFIAEPEWRPPNDS